MNQIVISHSLQNVKLDKDDEVNEWLMPVKVSC